MEAKRATARNEPEAPKQTAPNCRPDGRLFYVTLVLAMLVAWAASAAHTLLQLRVDLLASAAIYLGTAAAIAQDPHHQPLILVGLGHLATWAVIIFLEFISQFKR